MTHLVQKNFVTEIGAQLLVQNQTNPEFAVLCLSVFYQRYGEIVNINLVRDKKTGKFKGYGFIAYEDQRSTILAVDNLNSIKVWQ